MKNLMIGCLTFIFSGLIVGCGTVINNEIEQMDVDSGEEVKESEETATDSSAIDASDIKEIAVIVEGKTEMRQAQFNRSGLGYSIYILEDYQLVSEEPNRDVIYSKFDDSFFTRVIVHSADADSAQIKENTLEHAEGDMEELEEVPLAGVEFALRELVESDGEMTSIIHVAKKFSGQLIEFTILLPSKEAAEEIESSTWAMLKTVDY